LFRRALTLEPGLRGVQLALGMELKRIGRLGEAADAYRAALALDPGDRVAALQLAWLCAIAPDSSERDGALALELCERACGAAGCQTPAELDILGIALMEAGRRDEAIQTARRATELARARGDTALAAQIEARIADYARGELMRVRLSRPSPGG